MTPATRWTWSLSTSLRSLVRAVAGRPSLSSRITSSLSALGHDDHLFLDARRRDAVGRRAVGLDREDHPGLELHRVVERVQPADDRPFVEAQPEPVAEVEAERGHLALEPDLRRLRKGPGDPVGRHARLDQRDRLVHPLARLLVGADLRRGRAADAEGAVVAGPVADERLDDVEEGLVARADESVGEVVGAGAAATDSSARARSEEH